MNNKNILIKGTFTPFDRYTFQTSIVLIIIFILLYKILSADEIINNAASMKTILSLFAFIAIFLFMYWITTSRYYFYEFSQEKITIRNFFKKYERNFLYANIIKIKFIGKIDHPILYTNTIHIIYNENGIQKSYSYQSKQFETKDWIQFIKIVYAHNMLWEDSDSENLAIIKNHLK